MIKCQYGRYHKNHWYTKSYLNNRHISSGSFLLLEVLITEIISNIGKYGIFPSRFYNTLVCHVLKRVKQGPINMWMNSESFHMFKLLCQHMHCPLSLTTTQSNQKFRYILYNMYDIVCRQLNYSDNNSNKHAYSTVTQKNYFIYFESQ